MNMRETDGIRATRSIKIEYRHVLVLGYSADPKDYNVSAMRQVGALYGAIPKWHGFK
jgi:hypothetical protein